MKGSNYSYILKSHMSSWSLQGKRVLVRADLNVPLNNMVILGDYKLQRLLPTLEYIKQRGGTIILISHIGRPTTYDPALSTRILIPWFAKHGYSVHFCSTLQEIYDHPADGSDILLLENTRFFVGEKPADPDFASHLARLGDYFVQDAFGSIHNHDASIALVPTYFPCATRSIGLLVEEELKKLSPYRLQRHNSLIMMIGGKKIASKVAYLHAMLDRIHTLILLPPFVFTFLHAYNKSVGKSYIDPSSVSICKALLEAAEKRSITVIFPLDYYIAHHTLQAPVQTHPVTHLCENDIGIACGPHTIEYLKQLFKTVEGTLIVNGLMGFLDQPKTTASMLKLFDALAHSPINPIIGGGDTTALVQQSHLLSAFNHLSTGGGALLAYLSGTSLPGLDPFIDSLKK